MINKKYSKGSFLAFIVLVFVMSAFACSAKIDGDLSKKYKDIIVTNCSFIDELFDYCKTEQLKRYQDAFENQTSNFNKNYVLLKVYQSNPLISGIAVVSKQTGLVYTMSYSFQDEKELSFNLNSDVFCLEGEVYSQSRGDGRSGKSCFKFNTSGFAILKPSGGEGTDAYQKLKKDSNSSINISNQDGYVTFPIPIALTDLIQCKSGMRSCVPNKKYKKYWLQVDAKMKNSAKNTICAMGGIRHSFCR